MTNTEFDKYWMPARNKLACNGVTASRHLASILGLEYPEAGFYGEIHLTPDLKQKLRLLAGPYANTVAKIIKARSQP